jgi:hypothetical protein
LVMRSCQRQRSTPIQAGAKSRTSPQGCGAERRTLPILASLPQNSRRGRPHYAGAIQIHRAFSAQISGAVESAMILVTGSSRVLKRGENYCRVMHSGQSSQPSDSDSQLKSSQLSCRQNGWKWTSFTPPAFESSRHNRGRLFQFRPQSD